MHMRVVVKEEKAPPQQEATKGAKDGKNPPGYLSDMLEETRILLPGTQVSLFTGFGVSAAAQAHFEIATHVLAHGTYPPNMPRMPEKDSLIRQDLFDVVIGKWADRTGRPRRPQP